MVVAQEILRQLGSNKFLMMTGSKNLIWGTNSLSMKLTPNKSKSKYLRIDLKGDDTYSLEFSKVSTKTLEKTIIKQLDGVYATDLQKVFTDVTGLYTSL